jgi:cell division protein FtsW (lipid II flippase)
VKSAFDRIPMTLFWIFIGYLVVVNSEYASAAYEPRWVEHLTLNTLRLGYAIVAFAVFEFIFHSLRDRRIRKTYLVNENLEGEEE